MQTITLNPVATLSNLWAFAPDALSHLVDVASPSEVRRARFGGKPVVAVRRTIDNARHLHRMGIKAGSPINDKYDWPAPFKAFDHQIHTSAFLTLNERAFVLSEMGVGKSASAIWAWDYLKSVGRARKLLIVCPLTCVGSVWVKELAALLPGVSVAALTGTKARRKKLLEADYDVFVINHHGLTSLCATLAEDDRITHIVADECTFYKNDRGDGFKAMRKVLDATVTGYTDLEPTARRSAWAMTGTPMGNHPVDAWSLAKLFGNVEVPHKNVFRDATCTRISMGPMLSKWVPRKNSSDAVFKILQPAIRYAKADCLDMPPVQYIDRVCDTSAEQRRYVKALVEEWMHADSKGVVTAVNAAARLAKLLQVYSGEVRGENGVIPLDGGNRMETLVELIDGSVGGTFVLANFTASIDRITKELKAKGYTVAKIDGSVSAGERQRIVQQFQAGELQVLVAHPKTASHGITLTAATTTVWWGPQFSTETYEQANNRMNRPGQRNSMLIVHLYGGAVEIKAYNVVRNKSMTQGVLLDLYRSVTLADYQPAGLV